MFTSQVFAATEEDRKIIDELENMQNVIFSAPITPLTEIDYSVKEVPETRIGRITTRPNTMPLFKKVRIKIQNYYRTKAYEEAQQIIEEERKTAEELNNSEFGKDTEDELQELTRRQLKYINNEEADSLESSKDKNEKKIFNIFKKKKNTQKQEISDNPSEKTSEEQPAVEKSEDTVELSGSVKKLNSPKEAQLDCDVLQYYEDRNEVEATGNPVMYFPTQDVTLKGDRLVYNTEADTIKAYGNVEVTKDGNTITGDFIQINMNEENALVTNMKSEQMNVIIRAKDVKAKDEEIELKNGSLSADKSYIMRFKTRIIGSDFSQMILDEDDRSTLIEKDRTKINVDAKNIIYDAKKDHDVITIQDAELTFNKTHLMDISRLKLYTNKKQDYFEGNYPEFGSRSRIGIFLGPGFVFGVPTGGTVKLIPFLNYKGGFGVGGAVKYRSSTNTTEFMYGSAENIAVLRGRQYFDDKFFMQYGINSYMDDWFMGTRMAKYMTEFIYQDGVRLKNFAGPKHDLTFKHRLGAGYMQDSDHNRSDEKNMQSSEIGTTRLKYMAEIAQNVYKYRDEDKLRALNVDIVMQGSASLYGTGDTQFMGRIGPRLHTQYKYWMQDVGYFQSAYQDESPLPRFDAYRYGKSSVYLRESLRLNKYLAVTWAGTINLSDDAPNGKMFQENAFIFALGPDDFKVIFGYDFMRKTTRFGVNIALDMKGTNVNYDKLVIKNPDKLGSKEKEVKPVNFEIKPVEKQIRTYAEVIDIEDPDREQI